MTGKHSQNSAKSKYVACADEFFEITKPILCKVVDPQ